MANKAFFIVGGKMTAIVLHFIMTSQMVILSGVPNDDPIDVLNGVRNGVSNEFKMTSRMAPRVTSQMVICMASQMASWMTSRVASWMTSRMASWVVSRMVSRMVFWMSSQMASWMVQRPISKHVLAFLYFKTKFVSRVIFEMLAL